ncbi:unnamed protein product, partial [Ixodes persulcatus]
GSRCSLGVACRFPGEAGVPEAVLPTTSGPQLCKLSGPVLRRAHPPRDRGQGPSGRRWRPRPSWWRPTRAPASLRKRATWWPGAWAASAWSWPTGWWPGAAVGCCSRAAQASARATSTSACTAGGWPAPRWR